jgi:thiamine phosphate synthase YjbQ (UPF0047 family)
MVFQQQIQLTTRGHRHMHDLTEQVCEIVARSKLQSGLVHIFCVGSTAAVGAIEFEPGLQHDLPELLDRLIPPSRDYGHEHAWHDGNVIPICRRPFWGRH